MSDFKSNPNYIQNRMAQAATFKEVFTNAFAHSEEAQVTLTGALVYASVLKRFDTALEHLISLEPLCQSTQDEASLCYFKGLMYDFSERYEEMEICYDRFLELNEVSEPIYIFLPYVRRAKLLHKSCKIMKSQEYFCKVLSYYEKRGRATEKSLSLHNLYFDLASSFMFCHDYTAALDFAEKAHLVWSEEPDDGNKMIEMMLFSLVGKTDKARVILDSIEKTSGVYSVAGAMLYRIASKTDPHYFALEHDGEKIKSFWEWFLKNEKKLFKLAFSNEHEKLKKLLSDKMRAVFHYMMRDLAMSIELDDRTVKIVAYTDYVLSLDCGLGKLFEAKPKELTYWSFEKAEEILE